MEVRQQLGVKQRADISHAVGINIRKIKRCNDLMGMISGTLKSSQLVNAKIFNFPKLIV